MRTFYLFLEPTKDKWRPFLGKILTCKPKNKANFVTTIRAKTKDEAFTVFHGYWKL